ncbi:MAG: hypothetical protein HYR96_12360 [Deltaproteobacteria bacterium]|nr:hypothetical protein [Deltaproteobacteria bacterium]MBI3296009.1 hypothetical protein [Deltaproteobacteria bacterium]
MRPLTNFAIVAVLFLTPLTRAERTGSHDQKDRETNNVTTADKSNFASKLAKVKGDTLIVDFWSQSCSPCLALKKEIEGNATKAENKDTPFFEVEDKKMDGAGVDSGRFNHSGLPAVYALRKSVEKEWVVVDILDSYDKSDPQAFWDWTKRMKNGKLQKRANRKPDDLEWTVK